MEYLLVGLVITLLLLVIVLAAWQARYISAARVERHEETELQFETRMYHGASPVRTLWRWVIRHDTTPRLK